MVTIITIVREAELGKQYLFRTMKNVDEQSMQDWHHILMYDTQEAYGAIHELLKLRSERYIKQSEILPLMPETVTLLRTHMDGRSYVAIHPMMDQWSPLFLEKMILEIEQAPVSVAGVWSQYNDVAEVLRGQMIVSEGLSQPHSFEVGCIRPHISEMRHAIFIQALYSADMLYNVIDRITDQNFTALFVAAHVLSASDILVLPENLAFHHKVDPIVPDIVYQVTRNWISRTYPYMIGSDE